jgi:hypothetical protein
MGPQFQEPTVEETMANERFGTEASLGEDGVVYFAYYPKPLGVRMGEWGLAMLWFSAALIVVAVAVWY